jgi:hypothetical protein
VDIAASALLRGCVHVPGTVTITAISPNAHCTLSLRILDGYLIHRPSTFVLLVRRGIVLAVISNVPATLGYSVACIAMFPTCVMVACVVIASV